MWQGLSLVNRNILANLAGNAWTGVITLAFVPIYLRYIGAEGYGLIGFFASITAVLSLLDGGLAAAGGRKLAQTSDAIEEVDRARALVRSLEVLFWGVALLAGIAIILVAPLLVRSWLRVEGLGEDVAVDAIRLLGLAFIVQWPVTLYNACLLARQQQVRLNVFVTATSTFKAVGAILVLTLVSPTVHAFFTWQVVASALSALVARQIAWRSLPEGSGRERFSLERLKEIVGFAAGVSAINVLSVLLTQVDKIVLSKLLPLAEFGYYVLAWNLAMLLYSLTGPVFNALVPRVTQLHAQGKKQEFIDAYWRGCGLIAIAIVPAALLPLFFAHPLLLLWSQDLAVVSGVEKTLQILAVGTMLNGLTLMPYGLQLACGWTGLALRANFVSVIVLVPLVYFTATLAGGVGAAAAWPLLNFGYVLIVVPLVYRRLLPGTFGRWLTIGVALPIAAVLAVYTGGRALIDDLARLPALHIGAIAVLYFAALAGVAALQRALPRGQGAA